jgi:nucleotide-binding universal stress UspA family protein
MSPAAGGNPRIVVGVDGSPESVAALRWAIRQAGLTGGTVEAVTAWRLPIALAGYGLAPVAVADRPWMEHAAGLALERAVAEATSNGDGHGHGPGVRSHLVQGVAAHVLVKAASGADLLVVGGRGSGLTGARLGSVSLYCVRHASCPVVIVPAAKRARAVSESERPELTGKRSP